MLSMQIVQVKSYPNLLHFICFAVAAVDSQSNSITKLNMLIR